MTPTRSIRRKWPGRWPNWALRSSPLPSFPCWILQTRSPLPTAFGLGFLWFGGRCGGNCRGGPPIRRPWQSSQRRGWLSRHTAPRLSLRRRKVRLSPFPPDDENCARSLAPPLQRKPTPLGFALGAAFGGLYNIRVRGLGISLLGSPLLRWGSSCAVGVRYEP